MNDVIMLIIMMDCDDFQVHRLKKCMREWEVANRFKQNLTSRNGIVDTVTTPTVTSLIPLIQNKISFCQKQL